MLQGPPIGAFWYKTDKGLVRRWLPVLFAAYKPFTGPGHTYLWRDQFHPTTKLHQVLAHWMLNMVTNTVLERLELTQLAKTTELRMSRFSPSRSYTLRNSSDLRAWANLSTFVPTAGTNSIPLANLGQAPSFYRLRLEN